MSKKILSYVSPIGLIISCSIAAVLLYPVFDKWVFIPVFVLYWGISFLITLKLASVSCIKNWLQKPIGKIRWPVLSVIAGFIPLQIFLVNLHIITLPSALLSIPFVLLNPFFEELYWRGFVLDFTFTSKKLSSLYSSILFVLSHLCIWGVFSYGNRNWFLLGSLVIMSTVWCMVRIKTKSLWWCIISHFFVDVFNLMVFVMLNLYIPEQGYITALELLFGPIK
ncbi:MAG: CPBP family intramembrane metalloprotease [Treponema sp.]|jgi:membrane protease YdiL (CAAX protease family)|nr:CPBP family intramembrane metalloprotease [Treponema sp.]